MNTDNLNNRLQRSLYPIISITVPLLVYAAVLIIHVPDEVGLAARYDFRLGAIAIIGLLLYVAYRQSGWIGTLASLSLSLILFALPLSALWNSGISDGFLIGGLLPWSDASDYYWDARRLLEGGTFSAFSSRRPLFSGMLAALLGLTQQNLQVTLAILVAITAISCFLMACEIQRSHGTVAGLLAITQLFLFYRRFIGKISTESLGLALGAVGFALVWRGARQRQINNCLLGILLLTLALNARAGTFFILPAIILWGAWSFRGAAHFSWRFLISGASVVLLGFILNSILLKTIGSPKGMTFSNFSYTLYGLSVGSNWTQVMVDYPELNGMSEPELSQKIYALAFETFRANPLGLVISSLRAWQQFIFSDGNAFSFTWNNKTSFALQMLSVVALFTCYRQRLDLNASLMLATTLGILASVPFVPPWDADTMRAYAATLPIISALPALGFAFVAEKMEWFWLIQVPKQEKYSRVLLMFSIALALFSFMGGITIKMLSRTPQFADVACLSGRDAVYLRISPGSSIKLVADDAIPTTHLPNIRLSDFKARMDGKGVDSFKDLYPELTKKLTSINPSTTMMNTFNLRDWKWIWLIADSSKVPKNTGIVGVCGKLATNTETTANITRNYDFFYAESIQAVSPIGISKSAFSTKLP